MTIGELKKLIEDFTDDFEVDIMGEHSGSFGTISRIAAHTEKTPCGDYEEVQFFIDA